MCICIRHKRHRVRGERCVSNSNRCCLEFFTYVYVYRIPNSGPKTKERACIFPVKRAENGENGPKMGGSNWDFGVIFLFYIFFPHFLGEAKTHSFPIFFPVSGPRAEMGSVPGKQDQPKLFPLLMLTCFLLLCVREHVSLQQASSQGRPKHNHNHNFPKEFCI